MNVQERIIRWYRLEGDVSVPRAARESAWLGDWIVFLNGTLLLPDAANNRDLIPKFTSGFCDGVDMETRRLWLMLVVRLV